MSASTSVQGQQKLNKNLKTLKSGIRGMMLGGLSSARPVVAMGPEDKRPEAREDNIRDGEDDEEELNIDDLATVPRVVDNNNNEGSMDLTESASGLRTSLHIKQQKALEEEEQAEEGQQRQRSVKRHDSPRGAEDWAGVSGSTAASSTHNNNSQQAPPQDLSLMVGSDPNIYYKEAAAASPLSPVASAVGPLKYPTSAPIQMQTGTGYAPNGVQPQQQQSLSQTSHSLHNSQQQQPPPTSSMNKFLRGKIKISALKNLVVNPLDLSSTSAHHTSSKQQQQQQSLKSSVKQSRIDESDIVDHSRRHNDDDHHDDHHTDGAPQPQQKKLGGKARKLMRNSIIGLKNLGKVSTNRSNVILLEDDTSTTFSNAQDSLPPLKSMADTKYAKPVEEQPNQDLLDQGVAQLHVAKSVFHENEQAKQRRRKRVAKRNTDIGDYLLTSSTTSQPTAAELEHFSVGTEERRSKSKPKLDPQARERLKRHSRQREERYRSSANRRRRRHMADHSSRGSVMSASVDSSKQDSSFMDRMSVSDRLSSVGRLSVHTTTTNDRLHSSEGQMLDHAAALDADESAIATEPKVMPLRAPSGGGDHHPPQSSNRKLKKEQDGKLRERVRSRQSLAMQHAKEPSFSALELLAQDDDESFADDIDQSVGSMEDDEHQYHDEDDDHDDGDVFATTTADEARHHQEVSLKDIFSSSTEQPHLASSSAYTVDSVSANVSLDVTAGQGSFQHVEGARSDDYLQLVIGDNVPAKLASPTSTAKEGEDAETAPVVVTKPERKMVRRRSKTRLTEDEKHSSKRSSSRPSSGMRREGSSRRLAAGDKKEQRRSKPKSSSRRRTKSPRRKSDQTGTRRRKISARDSMGNASEPAITCTNTALEESAENLTHIAAEEEQAPVDASARTQDGDANGEREGSGSGNREAPQIEEPAGDPVVADTAATAEPSDAVASSNKESRREEGGRDHNKESRKRQPRSGKEKRSVDRKPKKSSNKSGGSDEKHKHRPSSTRGRDGTKKHRSSTRGRSEAGKRESRGDRGQTRRRHSLDARKRLSSTAHHVDTVENAAAKKDAKPLDPQDKKFSASLADIKW